jgi:Skp family chaperone for outer membrane proteins
MRRVLHRILALAVAAGLSWSGPGQAQQRADLAAPILTLDEDRLFTSSQFGRASIARIEAEADALQQESRRIDAAMEAEERALTEQRPSMDPAAFRALADAFDVKVNGLRAAQDAKARDLTRRRDLERQRFFEAVVPVLGEIMTDRGAVAIIDKSALVLSFDRVDITDVAIARIDAVLGADVAGSVGSEPPDAETPDAEAANPEPPAPGPAPGPAPDVQAPAPELPTAPASAP